MFGWAHFSFLSSTQMDMQPTVVVQLNTDCWLYVFAFLYHDFRSLGRLCCTSRMMFRLVTPVLYGQLFTKPHKNALQQYSPRKQRNLARLLLFSSGFFSFPSLSSSEGDYRDDDDQELVNNHNIVSYGPPITVNYMNLLRHPIPKFLSKWLPDTGLAINCQKCDPTSKLNYDIHFAIHHAEYIGKLESILDNKQSIEFLPHVQRFRMLKTLHLLSNHNSSLQVFGDTESMDERSSSSDRQVDIQGWLDFVTAHKLIYPGQLKKIQVPPFLMNQHLALNDLLGPTKFEISGLLDGQHYNQLPMAMTTKNPNLEKLVIGNACQFSDLVTAGLKGCRRLEDLQVTGECFTNDMFQWAVQEREDEIMKRFGNETTSNLVKLKKLVAKKIATSTFMNAVNAFRNSLTIIEYMRPLFEDWGGTMAEMGGNDGSLTSSSLMVVHWTWTLPVLTTLYLHRIRIDYQILEFCPVLQYLTLVGVSGIGSEPWKPPKSLISLKLNRGDSYLRMAFQELRYLTNLSKISLNCCGTSVDEFKLLGIRIDKINFQDWWFPNLLELTMSPACFHHWRFRFMSIAPNLAFFNIPKSRVDRQLMLSRLELVHEIEILASAKRIQVLQLVGCLMSRETNLKVLELLGSGHFSFLRAVSLRGLEVGFPEMTDLIVKMMDCPAMEQILLGDQVDRWVKEMIRMRHVDPVDPDELRRPLFPKDLEITTSTLDQPTFCILSCATVCAKRDKPLQYESHHCIRPKDHRIDELKA